MAPKRLISPTAPSMTIPFFCISSKPIPHKIVGSAETAFMKFSIDNVLAAPDLLENMASPVFSVSIFWYIAVRKKSCPIFVNKKMQHLVKLYI